MKAIIVAAGRGRGWASRPTTSRSAWSRSAAGRSCTGSSTRWSPPASTTSSSSAATWAIASPGRRRRAQLRFVDNPQWAENNILTSLFYAEAEMADGFLFSYSDIVFTHEHARRVAAADGADRADRRSPLA